MVRPAEVVALGISLPTVYRRARALKLSKPYKFTKSDVKRILAYKGKKS